VCGQKRAHVSDDNFSATGNFYYEILGGKGEICQEMEESTRIVKDSGAILPTSETELQFDLHRQRAALVVQQAVRCHIARLTYYMLLGIEADFGNLTPPETAREAWSPVKSSTAEISALEPSAGKTRAENAAALLIQGNLRCHWARSVYYELLDCLPNGLDSTSHNSVTDSAAPESAAAVFTVAACAKEVHKQDSFSVKNMQQQLAMLGITEDMQMTRTMPECSAACVIQRSYRCFEGKNCPFKLFCW
jgi:hypothetical protein